MLFQVAALFGFGLIAIQDLKERMVHWVLFPLVALFLGMLHWQQSTPDIFALVTLTNIFFVTFLIFTSWLYVRYIKKIKYVNHSLGLGDILFFYALAFGFPTSIFLVLFISALLFSLAIHLVLGLFKKQTTIPLAGYMSLFLIVILLLSNNNDPYQPHLYP
ncbi:MAG: hypothetical protein AAF039_03755 [Bacteroidota bacterium]